MRSTSTAVLERDTIITRGFTTEPYELPWADEARFFVHALDAEGRSGLSVVTQISPDGLHWCDLDVRAQSLHPQGLTSWSVNAFGQWLRVRIEGPAQAALRVRIYLVGKG